MKIRALRTQKTKLHGVRGKLRAFMGRLLTLRHFHRIATLLAKVGQQPFQPLGGEIVTPGMGDNRLAARMMNDINRLFYCTPLRRNVSGFPAGKIFLKRPPCCWHAGLHQKTGKMAAGDRPAVRQLQRPSQAPGIRAFSRRSAIICAQLATRFLLFQQRGHRRVRNINIQPTI
jgi:hypothetical protein